MKQSSKLPRNTGVYYFRCKVLERSEFYYLTRVLSFNKFPNSIDRIKTILENNSELNFVDRVGYNALILLCEYCNDDDYYDIIKLLIDVCIDIDYQCPATGLTALMIACKYSYKNNNNKVINLLIDSGANITIQSNEKRTALMYYLWYNRFNESDVDLLMKFIIKSQKILRLTNTNSNVYYDIYVNKQINILDEYQLRILKGEIIINATKSARKLVSD